jgi:cysteinyl-tRNA synthetase
VSRPPVCHPTSLLVNTSKDVGSILFILYTLYFILIRRMQLHNSLSRQTEEFIPQNNHISVYSCGPTVYNNLTIGNLSAFIYADLLRRTLRINYPNIELTHVMNITDVDDKTIRDSKIAYPTKDPIVALLEFTQRYETVFMNDIAKVGIDLDAFTFIRATDNIQEMQDLIIELYNNKIAYLTEDGVYFSIEAYEKAGKTYGQLVYLEKSTDTKSRIANDEYDKDSVNDFVLWKLAKEGEPSWEFTLDNQDITGRPGWHIECSAMSRKLLGKEFDIHTGGIDLKFPHHENEIAQSTACGESSIMAKFFVHNDHMLVDGIKMSKSLGNFFTLRDIEERGFAPLAFRLLVLQGHYSNSVNFSWENLQAASNRLQNWRMMAALRWQPIKTKESPNIAIKSTWVDKAMALAANNLDTPSLLSNIDMNFGSIHSISTEETRDYTNYITLLDDILGLQLAHSTPDISSDHKHIMHNREIARNKKDWAESDRIRDELRHQGIDVRDDKTGQLWSYI